MADEAVVAAGDATEVQNSAAELEVANQDGGESSEQANDNQRETEEEQRPHKKGGWQRKIERLEKQNEALIQALLERKPVETAKPKESAPAEDKRPRKEDFIVDAEAGTYDADKYEQAVEDWRDRQYEKKLKTALEERDNQSKKQSEQSRIEQSWREKETAFKADHEDYEDTSAEAYQFLQQNKNSHTVQALGAAITESEVGPALLHHLGSEDGYAELERIAKLSPLAAVRELGKIEARLADQKSAEAQEDEPDEVVPVIPPVKASPKPPTPVKKTSSVKAPSIHDPNLPFKEYVKLREAGKTS